MLVSGYTSDSDNSDASEQTVATSVRVESAPTVVETVRLKLNNKNRD